MIERLLNLFRKKKAEAPAKTSTPKIMCTDCGNTENFFEGPSGGMCTNVMCGTAGCGQWWNACVYDGVVMRFDRLDGKRG